MKTVSGSSCYVCGHGPHSFDGKRLHFHRIPSRPTSQPVRDQWLNFLHLPPSSSWPEELWRNITLCSLHFDEVLYPRCQEQVRICLKGAVPSRKQPTGPGVLGEIFSPGSPENSCSESLIQEDLCTQIILNEERKELCRLCGKKGSLLFPIFEVTSSDSSSTIPISSKIEMYLPLKVKEEDPLPYHICTNCCDILNHWHEFYVTSVAADSQLRKIFGRQRSVPPDDIDCTNSCVEDVQQNAASITIEVEAQIQQKPTLSLVSHEIQGKEDIAFAENGGSSAMEDRSFKIKFDKNVGTYRNISYKCKYCYELFKNSVDRRNHVAKCRLLSTICDICGQTVSCRKNLMRHKYSKHNRNKMLHVTDTRYLCDKCCRCFKTIDGLRAHMRNIHDTQDRSMKYYCKYCCTAFRREASFHIHKKKHEKGMIKSVLPIEAFCEGNNAEDLENTFVYSCPVCQEKFNGMLSFVVHLTTKKKIKCEICHKVMFCEKRLYLHKCGQWTCQYCLKTFDQREKWIAHERLHTGEKPFNCRICDLTFCTRSGRRRHEIRHNPSSFQCFYCGKNFKNKYTFEDHILGHEGKEFLCLICNKNFSGRRTLQKHTSAFHKN